MEIQEEDNAIHATTLLSNLLFSEDFEGSNPLRTVKVQTSTGYGYKVVSSNPFLGNKAARFELRSDDELASNGTRAEMLFARVPEGREKWYSFAAYFPSEDFKYDAGNECISQWHQGMGSPALSLRIAKDKFYIRTLPTEKGDNWKNLYFGSVIKDTWNEFVIHVVHAESSKGLIEIWRNGEKVLTYNGPNNYDEGKLPTWKLGIYKSKWNSGTTDTRKRVVYYDNIKISGKEGSLSQMISDFSFAQLPSLTGDFNDISLSVVNAEEETIFGKLDKGGIIRFHDLGTTKLNIKANVDSKIESVRFNLYQEKKNGSYEKIYSHVDINAPFALFDDDGKGNYYYGSRQLDYGKYKIIVTTYMDTRETIPVGDVYTSTFKIYK
ncbi:polysaccharide lyase [Echinicola arenosa]|nr:polysaccharide lyase [Echinicola arenosa]